ncbi:MAG: LysR substrate-binding domain-containing protein [Mucinivorans sp.]
MTIQQLEYVVAVDKYRHFVRAAEACGVTQSTLSAMIMKLETELGLTIFDRNSHPVAVTRAGMAVVDQARVVLFNAQQLREMVLSDKQLTSGELSLAIIPTVAPYILPRLFKELSHANSEVRLRVYEMRTEHIIDKLEKAEIDMAILATPLLRESLLEVPLYYEKFVAYVSPSEPLFAQPEIQVRQMPSQHLWVLQEGHCLRNQVFNFCEHRSEYSTMYEAGSIDTLVKIVDENGGYTVIPELHIPLLDVAQQAQIRRFVAPEPVREISLVFRQDYVRQGMVNLIAQAIRTIIPEGMVDSRLKKFAIRL